MSWVERRRSLILASAFLALVAAVNPHAVFGQQPPRGSHRIGFLSDGPDFAKRKNPSAYHQAFLLGLAEQGFVVGENLTIEYRFADRKSERLPSLARQLVARKVEVIFGCCNAGRAAAKATKTLPVVFAGITDPVATGMVQSLAHPGGNVTGVSNQGLEINTKRLELLKAAVPTVRRVAVLVSRRHPLFERMQHDLQAAARSLGIRVDFFGVEAPNQIEGAFAAMKAAGADSLLVQEAREFNFHARQISRLAFDGRLPSMCYLVLSVQEGCLMSYEQDFVDISRRVGGYVAKILEGASPADLPVEQPTKFNLVVNLKTAKALGLTLPPSIMLRADRVIE
jgi:putative ABC transport system substrate-binding protein